MGCHPPAGSDSQRQRFNHNSRESTTATSAATTATTAADAGLLKTTTENSYCVVSERNTTFVRQLVHREQCHVAERQNTECG